ncbi:Zinc finger homeobox protein 4 [Trachymyrmex cornetzi]|uniref:Zinc finger homeobox protein 4 n=1 Tax=Trachymyrmex cornetzi TaxID=471704 RepID=A0A195E2Z0_9HYME|nr:Zinc finger homeobox protein 4 [Trachymyrmex cornetzi]
MGSEFDLTSETEMSLNEVWNSRRIFMDDQWNELVKETKGFKSDYKSKKEKPLKIVMCCRQFTVNQRNELMQVLRETRYPDRRKLMELAERMGVSFQKISMWFRNIRRTKPRNKKGQAKSSSTHKNQKIVSSEFECENKNKEPQSQKIVPRGKRFTVGQRDELIRILEETRYPGKIKMAEIAQKMGVSSPNISTWFRNNRRNQRNKQLMFSSTCDRQETVCPESVFKSGKKNPLKTTLRRKRFTANERKELIRGTVHSNFNYRNGTIKLLKTNLSRKTFTDDERNELMQVFEKNPYLKRNKMEKLSLKMEVPFHSINVWFKNARRYNREKVGSESDYKIGMCDSFIENQSLNRSRIAAIWIHHRLH